jgi:hypothetical protein
MGRPTKKAKDKFKRVTITLTPYAFKVLKKAKNKSEYIGDLIIKSSYEKNNI